MTLRRVGVFGGGRAANALCRTLGGTKNVTLAAFARDAQQRETLARLPHTSVCASHDALLSFTATEGALLMLAVSDDALAAVAVELASMRSRLGGCAVVHLSGARGLVPLAALPADVPRGFFHPLAALDAARPIPPASVIGVGADRAALALNLSTLAQDAGLLPWSIAPEHAGRYHLAATLVANLPVALFAQAMDLVTGIGIADDAARHGLAQLMRSMLDNLSTHAPGEALTGAVARGDAETVRRHLTMLDGAPAQTYRNLSAALAQIAPLSDERRETVLGELEKAEPEV